MTMSVTATSFSTRTESSTFGLERVQQLREKALAKVDILERKQIFEEAFQELKRVGGSDEDKVFQKALANLLISYANKALYNQAEEGDPGAGFRKSARLLEAVLLHQLKDLNLDWRKADSLESLVETFEQAPLFELLKSLKYDPAAITERAEQEGIRKELSETLIWMTYSHQNLSGLKDFADFHKSWTEITKAVIGDRDLNEKRVLADYQYNRTSFLAAIDKKSMEETVRSYQELETVFKDAYDKNDLILLGKLSQIHNMIGLVQLNAAKPLGRESEEAQTIYKRAKQHYDHAFDLRSQLESQAPSLDHRYFLSNIRTSLIECLVGIKPIDEEGRESLRSHKLALEAFVDELRYFNDRNSYIEYYRAAIDKAEQFLAS